MKINFLLLALLISVSVFSQKTTLTFYNPTYANEIVFLLKEKDFITKLTDTIASVKFDKNGKAMVELIVNKPFYAYMFLYKYQVWVYVEPNKTFQYKIPNKQYLTIEDSLNAYFTPISFYAIPEPYDSTHTQQAIIDLTYTIDTLLEKSLRNIRYKIKRKFVDSVLQQIQHKFGYCNSSYFRDYLFYQLAWLRYFSYERDLNFVVKKYFAEKPVLLENLAYTDFFNELFTNYLSYYATTTWGEHVFSSISKAKSPFELRKDLKRNPAFTNDTLIDLIILKGLHDAYYTKNSVAKLTFPKTQLLMTIDSMSLVAITPELRRIAKNISQKLLEEEKVFLFEEIPLYDLEGNTFYLRNFKGKYLYVSIFDGRAYNFLTEQKKMKALFSRFADQLKVITIVLYPNIEKLKKIITNEALIGNFFTIKNPEQVKKQLKIRCLPVYYLYSPDGVLLDGNAPPPEESLIPYFQNILK